MTREELLYQYRRLIIPESKEPYHFESRDGEPKIEAYNPICGDKYHVFLSGQFPKETHFHGHGCALSKASGSLMLRVLGGMEIMDCLAYTREFVNAVQTGKLSELLDERLNVLVQLKNHEGREDCILLTWKAILVHLESNFDQ